MTNPILAEELYGDFSLRLTVAGKHTQVTDGKERRSSEAGMTMIELLLAGTVLLLSSLGIVGLLVASIATNNRNKGNSQQTMLAESIVEHVSSTLIGTGDSAISDCAGHNYTIGTFAGGANLTTSGDEIDFNENISTNAAKNNYHMDYQLNT